MSNPPPSGPSPGPDPASGSAPPRPLPLRHGLLPPIPSWTSIVAEVSGLTKSASISLFSIIALILIGAATLFICTAPPTTLTMTSGPEGSIAHTWALKYAQSLKKQGVQLLILPSAGSQENLRRLVDPKFKVDVGFVQAVATDHPQPNLISLGSVAYQPLLVFYRGLPVESLAGLIGKRLVIGPEGSGTRNLVTRLLEVNNIRAGESTTFFDLDPAAAAADLINGKVDAIFLMGEDASRTTLTELLMNPQIRLLSFSQAEAYSRHFPWLSVLKIPEGVLDFGRNIPPSNVFLVGPTVELIARKTLHPALSDVMLEAAREVNGDASILQRKGEFPAPLEHEIPISGDARRFYKEGTTFFYHYLPFSLASLVSRIVMVCVPALVLLFPIVRYIPAFYRWRVQSHIYRWYRVLLSLEKQILQHNDPVERRALAAKLDEVEVAVHKMKIPANFADQFYVLRGHIDYVRQIINLKT